MKKIGPEVRKLISVLDAAASLLRSCGENHWADWLENDAALLRAGNVEGGIQHFLGAFGGMGSINDVVLTPISGQQIAERDVDNVYERFRALLSEASQLAKHVRARG